MSGCPVSHHGMSKASGCKHVAVSHFGRLLPVMGSGDLSEQEAAAIGGPGGLMHDFDDTSADSSIPAGYIFFAQFIDHDVTLDTTSDLRGDPAELDVDTLPNIRSASLDLDCVYGFGPEASPHIYDAARSGHIAIHPNGHDVARAHGGQALIGDPRNDENIFVSQIQLMFQRFHNKMYEERLAPEGNCKHLDRFEEAQKQCRYHYQWLVLFDFLKRLCDPCVFRHAVPKILAGDGSQYPYFHKPDAHGKLRMPVEFSAAAYRVGHTMVRSRYAANAQHLDIELFDERFGTLGFSGIPEDLVMDWRYLLPVHRCIIPRMAKGIDPKLADEIQAMPLPVVNSRNPNDRALGFRNLMRGNVMRLPSGQQAAAALKEKYGDCIEEGLDLGLDKLPCGCEVDKDKIARDTPLFYYILRESEVRHQCQRLGPVGSAILLEVFGGMLVHCKETSFVHEEDWQPDPCVSKERWGWWTDDYVDRFEHDKLVNDPDYYPFELADVVRYVEDLGDPRA
jgi:hypothetical protein